MNGFYKSVIWIIIEPAVGLVGTRGWYWELAEQGH